MPFFVLSFHNIQSVTFHRTQMLQLQPSVNCGKKTEKPHLYTRLNCMLLLWCSPLRFFSPIYGFLWSIKCTRLSLSHTLLIHILSFAFTKIKTQTFHSFFFLRTIGFRTVFLQIVYGFVSSQRLWFQTTIYAICWSRTKTRLEFVHFSCGWLLFNCMRNGIHLRSINSKSVTLSMFELRCIQMRKVFARVAGIFDQIFGAD